MANSQMPGTSFTVGDKLGFVVIVAVQTGAIEAVLLLNLHTCATVIVKTK